MRWAEDMDARAAADPQSKVLAGFGHERGGWVMEF
jgi:hypothetical protein